jgi:hypothetical protein
MLMAERLWRISATRALAQAGAQQAVMAVMSQTNEWDGLVEDSWNRNTELFKEQELGAGEFSVYYLSSDLDGRVVTNFGIIGESGKINLNRMLKESKLRAAFENILVNEGKMAADEAHELVDGIKVVIGGDDGLTDEGSKEYSGDSSSKSADSNEVSEISSLAVLRSVEGMDAELYRRVLPYITVYGEGLINLNCAPEAVLEALAAACDSGRHERDVYRSLAARVVDFRQAGGVFADKSRDGIYKPLVESADLSGAERTVWNGMVGGLVTVKSSAFRGIAAGFLDGEERSGVTVEFVCDRESGTFVYWHEMQ